MTENLNDLANFLNLIANENLYLILLTLVLLQTVSAIFFLPCGYIPILCGFILGGSLGSFIAIIAQWIATISTYFIGLNIKQMNFIQSKNRITKKLDLLPKTIITSGWRDFFILRQSFTSRIKYGVFILIYPVKK